MSKITKIEVQQNNKERFNIYVDDRFAIGISMDTMVHFNLKKGDTIESKQLKEIELKEYQQQAINDALNYLSYRKRTRFEVEQHLTKKGYPETTIEPALMYCEKHRLIDHEDYAESLKNTMIRTSDKGPEIFRQKLRKAGVESHLIENMVDRYAMDQPFDNIIKIAQKIANQKKGPSNKIKQQVHQSLMQKGYHQDSINAVLDTLNFEQDPEEVEELLQQDLEKVYNKYQRKYEGFELTQKTIQALMRKGYTYDAIKHKLTESGIDNDE